MSRNRSIVNRDDTLKYLKEKSIKSNYILSQPSVKHIPKTRHSMAKERWKLLKKAILDKDSAFYGAEHSIRRFNSFGFIKCVKQAYNNSSRLNYNREEEEEEYDDDDEDIIVKKTTKKNYEWYSVSIPSIDPRQSINVRFYDSSVSVKDLIGFNNTGNICLWPSEEIMTLFCAKNSAIFDNKSVCELGGGMTCLAGLMIGKFSQPKEVFLTDGNESSFENLEKICSKNEFECSVECCLLQWNKDVNYGDLEERFDYIICADCLFFDEFRDDLCGTIYRLLKNDGTCLIFAPNRKNTFHKFVDMAKLKFECMIVNDYDLELWEKHLNEKENNPDYDEDIHYPLLLKLKKRNKQTIDFCKMVL